MVTGWGADAPGAARAQALIAVWQPPVDPEAIPVSCAGPDRIDTVIEDDPRAAPAVPGLTLAPPDAQEAPLTDLPPPDRGLTATIHQFMGGVATALLAAFSGRGMNHACLRRMPR